jgi:peptidoglycan biosynthesis protein MviN/MurJ (putative lipid II flippase)
MYLRAAVISLSLLLLSRVLGLVRESVQAYSFGTTAVADMVVVMLTLPDLASTILAGGALSYALLPWWARQTPQALAASQRSTARIFLAVGIALAAWILLWPQVLSALLAPGVAGAMLPQIWAGMRWAALAVPLSLLTLVWYTRLQHERDVVGMYGMNVVHTGVVIAAMLLAGTLAHSSSAIVVVLGAGLLLAFVMRLIFLAWRLRRLQAPAPQAPHTTRMPDASDLPTAPAAPVEGLPEWKVWLWALLATGAPAAFPLLARSLVSGSGEGALATFSYAWKLVELPNQLAIQVVATLAFPAFTRAYAAGREFTVQLRAAFMLAWTLACAAALAMWLGAVPLTRLLFGWGRMGPEQVAEVAHWAALGAWTLLPQALMAVLVLVLATLGRLPAAALAYLAAVAALAAFGVQQGPAMMLAMTMALCVAVVLLLWAARDQAMRALAWREMAVPAVLCAALACARPWLAGQHFILILAAAGFAAALLLALSYLASPVLKAALKR